MRFSRVGSRSPRSMEWQSLRSRAYATGWLGQFKLEWSYKKVDSVLRCNVHHEIVAMGESLGLTRVLLVLADPSLGRVIRDGVYYVDDIPVDETDFANDPAHPVRRSAVVQMLVRSVSWPVVSGSRDSALPDRGILIGDAEDDEDLAGWASMTATTPTASAGGSEFLVALMEVRRRKTRESSWSYNREKRNLWLEGGATASAILRELGWERFKVVREIRLGVVTMKPVARRRPTVTVKPGTYE